MPARLQCEPGEGVLQYAPKPGGSSGCAAFLGRALCEREKWIGNCVFGGCNLRCVFCQNRAISQEKLGKELNAESLRKVYERLIKEGAENINLVTPTHFLPVIAASLQPKLPVPVVYNCGGYERVESLKRLEGLVDIYLPDLKYLDAQAAERYSHAPDYPKIAVAAIEEMYRQVGDYRMDKRGMIRSGLIVRHLVLPGNLENTRAVLDWFDAFAQDKDVLFSLMSQYTPVGDLSAYPEIAGKVSAEEYSKMLEYLDQKENIEGFVQERASADEGYIPSFALEGLEDID